MELTHETKNALSNETFELLEKSDNKKQVFEDFSNAVSVVNIIEQFNDLEPKWKKLLYSEMKKDMEDEQ